MRVAVEKSHERGYFKDMQKSCFIFGFLSIALVFSGCGRKHEPPPLERSELVVRFFRSILEKNPSVAVQQGKKLQQMMPQLDFMPQLIAIQESNDVLRSAQHKLDRGDIDHALKDIQFGISTYPDNRSLPVMRNRLRQLRNAPKLLQSMRNAKSSSSMRAALTAAEVGLAGNSTPELKQYFLLYNRQIALAAQKEAADAKAAAAALQNQTAPLKTAVPAPEAAKPAPAVPAPTAKPL